jgi:hypothetical protein
MSLARRIQRRMGEQIAGIEDLLLRVPFPIVFDHLGRLAQPNALDNPGFKTISKLIDQGKDLGQAEWRLSGHQGRAAHLFGHGGGRPRLYQGSARANGVGQRLAASDREGQARRRGPVRPAHRMGAGRSDAHAHPGAEPAHALRLPGVAVITEETHHWSTFFALFRPCSKTDARCGWLAAARATRATTLQASDVCPLTCCSDAVRLATWIVSDLR